MYYYDYDKYLLKYNHNTIVNIMDTYKYLSIDKYIKNNIKILLIDDSIATGKTMFNVSNYLLQKYKAYNIELKTCALIVPNTDYKYSNYYCEIGKVPVIWEWGVEVD
jgi:hypoxanthine phosphoribosyltransferase